MIQTKENLISHELLQKATIWLDNARWSFGWQSNKDIPYGHWNVDIAKTPKENTTDIKDKIPQEFKDIWKEINKEVFNNQAALIRCYANRHTFGTEGFIHTDTTREQDHTVVIYLNEDWHANWGGETTFYNQDSTEIIDSILPRYGRITIFPGTINHCVRPVSKICSKVRTTLMFKAAIDPKIIYPAEVLLNEFLIKIGADKKPHKVGSLRDHLLRVFQIMRSVGANDILALAGGLHSVYSTNAYKDQTLRWDDTSIRETFGPEVDRIVRLFATADRPKGLETPDGSFDDQDLFLLRCIECANLYDQNELDPTKYPNLYEFTKQFGNKG
jgi:SM-20-related protein